MTIFFNKFIEAKEDSLLVNNKLVILVQLIRIFVLKIQTLLFEINYYFYNIRL